MQLKILIDGNAIELQLKNGRKIIDTFAWNDQYSLSEKLLPSIDALLKKNGLSAKDVEKVSSIASAVTSVTSVRIIKAVEKALNFKENA